MTYSFFDSSLTEGITEKANYYVIRTEKGRLIQSPSPALAEIQGRLLTYLREHIVTRQLSQSSHVSIWDCVTPHCSRRHIFHTDIKGAFQSVDVAKMTYALAEFDSQIDSSDMFSLDTVKFFLQEYCFLNDHSLLTGSCASQDLFDLYCEVYIDEPLRELCRRYGIVYTRYADDLTFSDAHHPIGLKRRKAIYRILRKVGFEINFKKTKWIDGRKQTIEICGLTIGGIQPDRVRISRARKKRISQVIMLAGRDLIPMNVVTGYMSPLLRSFNQSPESLSPGEVWLILKYKALKRRKR